MKFGNVGLIFFYKILWCIMVVVFDVIVWFWESDYYDKEDRIF